MPACRVFVYGSLKPGLRHHRRLCASRLVASEAARMRGDLFILRAGYPALVDGEGWVEGALLHFPDEAIFSDLDAWEEYDPARLAEENMYERVERRAFSRNNEALGLAWTYVMSRERVIAEGGLVLRRGSWLAI